MEQKIRINRIIRQTRTEGFGMRYCIWVQGCSIRCSCCKNQHMWSFDSGEELEIEWVIQDIKVQAGIEGITILGGEPLDQKEAVAKILQSVQEMGLSTIIFTGYTYENLLDETDEILKRVLSYTDLLIDGPFRQEQIDFSRPWVSSENQRYLFLSSRYNEEDLYDGYYRNKYEVRIYPDGTIKVNGMGDLNTFNQILKFNE